jgi:predicted DNA-binding ribbon-helix-helix protein
MSPEQQSREPVVVERVQTGVRIEKRMLKVLKALAEQKDMTLGDLLEGIVLHAFEGKQVPFSTQTLRACLRSSEQQSEEGQVDHLHAGIEFAFAVFP